MAKGMSFKSPQVKTEDTKELDKIMDEDVKPNVLVKDKPSEEDKKKEEWAKADAAKTAKATRTAVEQLIEKALHIIPRGDTKGIERYVRDHASDLSGQERYDIVQGFLTYNYRL